MGLQVHPEAKALIFDLDGTLSNSIPVHILTWDKVGEAYGFKFDPKIMEEMTGRATIDFAHRIIKQNRLKHVSAEEIVELKQHLFWNSSELLKPVPEVIDIVRKYYGRLPLAVGTGASRKSAVVQLKALNLENYFDVVISANDVLHHKPNPDTFLKCAKLIEVSPLFCQVYEDGNLGIEAAKKAGMMVTDVRPFINYGDWLNRLNSLNECPH